MGRPRTIKLNENYFERIDSSNKAYILGFLYADGSVYRTNLSISLSIKDIEIIKFIRKELEFGGEFKIFKVNELDYVRLSITSKKLVNDLEKLGVIKNKTYESKSLPEIPNEYLPDMIRGFFDGDGSISSSKSNNRAEEFCLTFSSNIDVLEQVKNILLEKNISSSKIRLRRKDSKFSGMLEIKGSHNIEKFYNFVYNTNSFHLLRKYKRFLDFFDVISKLKKRKQTDEIINKILELYLSGFKQKEIHLKLGIPFSTIRGIVQRLRKKEKII